MQPEPAEKMKRDIGRRCFAYFVFQLLRTLICDDRHFVPFRRLHYKVPANAGLRTSIRLTGIGDK
jgi:hypothetical protein